MRRRFPRLDARLGLLPHGGDQRGKGDLSPHVRQADVCEQFYSLAPESDRGSEKPAGNCPTAAAMTDSNIAKEQVPVAKKRSNKGLRGGQTRQEPQIPPHRRSWTTNRMLTIGVAVLIGISAIAGWWWYHHAHRAQEVMGARASKPKQSPPDDPRLTFATPFLNVRPEVLYVGDEACAGCHEGHAKSFRQHPMGRSLALLAAATPVERY